MTKDKNISIDSIKEDALTDTEEHTQTSTEASITSTPESAPSTRQDSPKMKRGKYSVTGIYIDEDGVHEAPYTISVSSVDIKISKKYPITLEQARNRVLKTIKRPKKKNLLITEDD